MYFTVSHRYQPVNEQSKYSMGHELTQKVGGGVPLDMRLGALPSVTHSLSSSCTVINIAPRCNFDGGNYFILLLP